MCMIRYQPQPTACQNCGGHLATIGNKTRECEQCGYLTKEITPMQNPAATHQRDNPAPEYNWPETIFVRQNTTTQQLDHILSEVDEINQIGPHIDTDGSKDSPILRHLHMEIADLHHSIETYWRRLELERGSDYVAAVFQAVEDKNRPRGYYDLESVEEPLPCLVGPFGRMPQGV